MDIIIDSYLYLMEVPINDKSKVKFLYKGEQINEKVSAVIYFKKELCHKILVIDPNGVLIKTELEPGPKKNIILKTTGGTIHALVFNYGTTIDMVLDKYLAKTNALEYKGTNEVIFQYNSNRLKFGDQTPIEIFFKNARCPTIVVNWSYLWYNPTNSY